MIFRISYFLIGLFVATLAHANVLSWDRTEVKLEMKPEQEEIRADFKVTNQGEETVRIARVKTSCGCTGSIIDRKILKPGEATTITGTFNKGKRQGLNRNRLEVFIDSQAEPVATLLMTVQIPQLIQVQPHVIYWSKNSSKTERVIRVTLDTRYVNKIEGVESDTTKLDVSWQNDPKSKADLILRVIPKSFEEYYRGSIKVTASGPDSRAAEASLHVLVQK